MSGVVWTTAQVVSGSAAITFRQTGPPIPGLGAALTAVQDQFRTLAAEIAARMTAVAAGAVAWASFHPLVAVGPDWIRMGTGSENPILGYWVTGTAPHWPPWGPGSALANWATARGLVPFLVARKISVSGTPGHIAIHQAEAAEQARAGAQIAALVQRILTP